MPKPKQDGFLGGFGVLLTPGPEKGLDKKN